MKRTVFALLSFCVAFFASGAFADQGVRVILKGYDPVAYFTEGKPTKGDPKISYEWDEGRYYFVSSEHRAMFVADPERYAPQFGGYCTGSMSRGVRNEGHPDGWTIADGRLYVFGAPDAETAAGYKADAEKNPDAFRLKAAKAAANWRK